MAVKACIERPADLPVAVAGPDLVARILKKRGVLREPVECGVSAKYYGSALRNRLPSARHDVKEADPPHILISGNRKDRRAFSAPLI